jgi:hypothetical protein
MPFWRGLGRLYLYSMPCIPVLNLRREHVSAENYLGVIRLQIHIYNVLLDLCSRHKVMRSHYIYKFGSTDLFMSVF